METINELLKMRGDMISKAIIDRTHLLICVRTINNIFKNIKLSGHYADYILLYPNLPRVTLTEYDVFNTNADIGNIKKLFTDFFSFIFYLEMTCEHFKDFEIIINRTYKKTINSVRDESSTIESPPCDVDVYREYEELGVIENNFNTEDVNKGPIFTKIYEYKNKEYYYQKDDTDNKVRGEPKEKREKEEETMEEKEKNDAKINKIIEGELEYFNIKRKFDMLQIIDI